MDLMDLTQWNASRANVDASGAGAKIPWDEPDFSRRMFEQHLNQEHDWASRRSPIIAAHAAWIAEQLSVPSRILDMGCGPGLYTPATEQGNSPGRAGCPGLAGRPYGNTGFCPASRLVRRSSDRK